VRVEQDERVERGVMLGVRERNCRGVTLMIVSRPTVLKSPRSKLRSEVCQRTSYMYMQMGQTLI